MTTRKIEWPGSYPNCATPLPLRNLSLRNRIVIPAHSYGFSSDALGSKKLSAYLERRLYNGPGLAIIGEAEVADVLHSSASRSAGRQSRALYELLADLADHCGAHIFEQVFHPGSQVWYEENRMAFAPSSIPQQRPYLLPFELGVADLRGIRHRFGKAANEIARSGLRGIELKADQGKLHHQFLSRKFNQRTDEYGGDLWNRFRMIRECLEEIRSNVPNSMVVGIRLSGRVTPPDGCPPGLDLASDLTLEETLDIVGQLQGSRLVDYISISGETNSTVWGYRQNHGDETVPAATFRSISHSIKRRTTLPVLVAGRVLTLSDAEDMLAHGDCDAVGMARAFIADGDLLRKVSQRNPEPIRQCLSCNISCVGNTWYGREVRCVYDPLAGRELTFRYESVAPLTFAVLGAGPAGLEFARVAESLGSKIDIFEASSTIGGLINHWKALPGRHELARAIEYWSDCIERKPNIKLSLGSKIVDASALLDDYDYVVIATGASEVLPATARRDGSIRNLLATEAIDQHLDWRERNVVVVDANRFSDALGIAALLHCRGARVEIVCPYDEIGLGLDPVSKAVRLSYIQHHKISVAYWSDIRCLHDKAYVFDHAMNTMHELFGVTDVVWCINRLPTPGAQPGSKRCISVGDALWPAGLETTVRLAHDAAVSLIQRKRGQTSAVKGSKKT